MQTRKLTEVPQSEFSREANLIVEIDEELKRVPGSEIRQLITDEKDRAQGAEKVLADQLAAEALRAVKAETDQAGQLEAEVTRAKEVEQALSAGLSEEKGRAEATEQALAGQIAAEAERAVNGEKAIADALAAETVRAKAAEQANADQLAAETDRAKVREDTVEAGLTDEVIRAQAAEETLTATLSAETTRAKEAEKTIGDNLMAETVRASARETELQASIQEEAARAAATEQGIQEMLITNKPHWDDKYTKHEIDNQFSMLETSVDWKESVDTYADLATAYPEPEDGWTANVKDTNYTYRWSGTEWVAISANAIPKATQEVDGLLSKEDKAGYDDAYSKRHSHGNKIVLDKITQDMLDQWSAPGEIPEHTHTKSQITDFPTSFPANGGNADTVDGKHADAFALAAHTHTKGQITDFPAALRNPNALTISLNGASQGAYDGSAAKSVNVTAAAVGAAASSHNHDSAYVKKTQRTLTLTAAGWSGSYPFTQKISVSGVAAGDDIKVIGVYAPANATLDQVKAWNKAAGYLMCNPDGVAAGSITFKAYKKPAVNFQVITEGG